MSQWRSAVNKPYASTGTPGVTNMFDQSSRERFSQALGAVCRQLDGEPRLEDLRQNFTLAGRHAFRMPIEPAAASADPASLEPGPS